MGLEMPDFDDDNYATGGVAAPKKISFAKAYFEQGARLMPTLSEQEGREVWHDCIWLVKQLEGGDECRHECYKDKDLTYWKRQYPEEWKAFERKEDHIEGTPLEGWKHPLMTPAAIANLKSLNVFSLEHLSEISDATVQLIGLGGRKLREAAQLAVGGGDTAELQKQIDELKALLADKAEPKSTKKGKKIDESIDDSPDS